MGSIFLISNKWNWLSNPYKPASVETDFMSAMLRKTMRVEVIWLVHHNQRRGKHTSWVNLEVL